jgi:hypothetical protein
MRIATHRRAAGNRSCRSECGCFCPRRRSVKLGQPEISASAIHGHEQDKAIAAGSLSWFHLHAAFFSSIRTGIHLLDGKGLATITTVPTWYPPCTYLVPTF